MTATRVLKVEQQKIEQYGFTEEGAIVSRQRFLLLEDNSIDADLIQTTLVAGGLIGEVLRVETCQDFLHHLTTYTFDTLLVSYVFAECNGMSTLKLARSYCPDTPFIFISARLGEDVAIDAIKQGATDYVLKQRLDRLVPAINQALQEAKASRDRAALAFHQSENRLRVVATNLPGGAIFIVDRHLRYQLAEGKALEGAGLTPADFVGKTIWQALGTEMAKNYVPYYCQALRGESFEVEHYSHGRFYSSRGTPLYDNTGEVEAVLAVSYDITDRKHAEAALQEREERLQSALTAAHQGIWNWDLRTETLIWDDQCKAIFGLPPGFPVAYEWHLAALHPDDRQRVQNAATIALKTHHEFKEEYRTIHPDGTMRWILAQGRGYYDAANQPYRMSGIVMDITDRKRAEQEREQLLQREQTARQEAEQANRIKDEFLAVLSHELRSPLNPILGWSNLLRSGKLNAEKTAYALETIDRNAKLQARLIEDLLDVSRILRGKLSLAVAPVNLETAIRSALETVWLAAEAKSIQIQTIFEPNVGYVLGDSARLQQVVWNLLTNAIKFTPRGGQVKVRLSTIKTQSAYNQSFANNHDLSPGIHSQTTDNQPIVIDDLALINYYAQIQVEDTGKGITPDFLPYVFDYFRQADITTTRAFGGLGLGLAIVRHLVELHGGTVSADSLGERQGATFTVQLPLQKLQKDREMVADDRQSCLIMLDRLLDGVHILLVEDEADSRELIAFTLQQSGAIVTTVSSAIEALQVFELTCYNLLISDIGMPDMNGYELMHHIRSRSAEQGGQIPAIALTAYAGEANYKRATAVGFQQHLAKPVEPIALVETIAQLINCI